MQQQTYRTVYMKRPPMEVKVPVMFLKEGESFVAYSPALDLSTSASTLAKTQQRFSEAAQIFFDELVTHNTLAETLGSLGWKQEDATWQAPAVIGQATELVHI